MSLDHLFSTLNGEVIILCVTTMNLATFAQNTCTCFCFILLYLARYMEINIHAIGAINACLLALVYKVLYSRKGRHLLFKFKVFANQCVQNHLLFPSQSMHDVSFFIESYQLLDILLIWKLRRPNPMPPNLIGSCADRKQSKLCSYAIHKTGVFVQLTKANPWQQPFQWTNVYRLRKGVRNKQCFWFCF